MSSRRALSVASLAIAAVVAASSLGCGKKDHAKAGYSALTEGRSDVAIDELRLALQENEKDPDAHYNLGVAYENVGWSEKSIAEFERAVALDPKNPTFRAALGMTKRTIGYKASQEKRYADAARLFQEALVLAPDDAVTWYNLAMMLKHLDRKAEGTRALAKAIELDPGHYSGRKY